MRRLALLVFTALVLSSPLAAQALEGVKSTGNKNEGTDTAAATAKLVPTEQKPPINITVIDNSGTVRRPLPLMKKIAEDILTASPDNGRFGVVVVSTEARKSMFDKREDAIAFLQSVTPTRRGFTDLNRATDAALALVHGEGASRPTVITYLTDGKLEVPADFIDRADFVSVLKREFTRRPDIRVVVVNVNDGKLPNRAEELPSNVRVIPLSDWTAARNEVTKTLVPEIRQELSAARITVAPNSPQISQPNSGSGAPAKWSLRTIGMVTVGALILVVSTGVLLNRYRRKPKDVGKDLDHVEPLPENLLTAADIKTLPEPAPEPVALLEADLSQPQVFTQGPRIKLELGERVVIGKTPIASDITLPSLKQTQTLELRFQKNDSGATLAAYRLRPDVKGLLDSVLLNERPAPLTFELSHNDRLSLGGLAFRVVFTNQTLLSLLDGLADQKESLALSETGELSFTEKVFAADEHVSLRQRPG
jgi:hypothetical protein